MVKIVFSERKHNLIAIFPTDLETLKDYDGLLYSFLPTQIQMTAPIILHAPFKLDASREFVDSQNENLWFNFIIENLENFFKKIYAHFATGVKQDIIKYIPNKNNFFFKKTNEKIQCLCKNNLKGKIICDEKVFYTSDGTYECAKDIVSLNNKENIENPVKVFELLETDAKLFIPNYPVNMEQYNVRVISNVSDLLFKKGLKDETKFSEIVKILDVIGKDLNYVNLIKECCPLQLTKNQLLAINSHRKIYTAMNNYGEQCIKEKQLPQISFDIPSMEEKFNDKVRELITSADLDSTFEKYMKAIGYKFFVLNGIKQNFAIAGKNGIVVAEGLEIGSFASLTEKYDSGKVFAASLKIRQASDSLNKADDSMSDGNYLKLLRSVRLSIRNSYGDEKYKNYIKIINQSGMNKNRFLNELLQNADDCKYPNGEVPTFDLEINNDQIKVSYNELGFTKQNVRAITAIGESTKKLLSDEKYDSIGEKGVGFKSVFGVAESVEIHSNGFDFVLTDKAPTVPDKCDTSEWQNVAGTTLIFKMKDNIRQNLKEDKILRLCFCLRNLKNISIHGTYVNIIDTEKERIVSVNSKINDSKVYNFGKFIYDFEIKDSEVLKERSYNQRKISKQQRICFYIPKNYKTEKYPLYVGLPTTVDCNVPLIVDAPFELTTSRENVTQSPWNDLVRNEVYKGLLKLMDKQKEYLRIDVLKYVKFTTQNNVFTYGNFSELYLNKYDWTNNLRAAKILPVLNSKQFLVAEKAHCFIVPEVIALILKKMDHITNMFDGIIIDTYKKTQYVPLLERLGCRRSEIKEELSCISIAAEEMISDEKFREVLYAYLLLPATQQKIANNRLYDKVKELPVFPIRKESGVEYVPYSTNIYTHSDKKSDKDFLILETKILKYEQAQAILGNTVRINELTQEVYKMKYQKKLISYIESNRSAKEKAIYILNEYKNNFENFKEWQSTLKGMIDEIPMEFISGNYQTGNKFVNKKGVILSGSVQAILEIEREGH